MFHIIRAQRKATKPLQFCAGPSSVWQHHVLPRGSAKWNYLVLGKNKNKCEQQVSNLKNHKPCSVCVWLYLKTGSAFPMYGYTEEHPDIINRVEDINYLKSGSPFPCTVWGQCGLQSSARWQWCLLTTKPCSLSRGHLSSQGLGGLVLMDQDFFHRVVCSSDC